MFYLTNDFYDQAKRFLKGAALLGGGALMYVGLSKFFKNMEQSGKQTKFKEGSKNKIIPYESNQQNSILLGASFEPTSFSTFTSRSLLSVDDSTEQQPLQQRRSVSSYQVTDEFKINSYTTGDHFEPTVSSFSDNNKFVAVWTNYQSGIGNRIIGRVLNSTGHALTNEFPVNNHTTDDQSHPTVSTLPKDEFVALWNSYQNGIGNRIVGRIFNSEGYPLTPEFPVNNYTTSPLFQPTAITFPDEKFAVLWYDYEPQESNYGVFARILNRTGDALTPKFQINSHTTSNQANPAVSAFPEGNKFVVLWGSFDQDGDANGVFGRIFNVKGYPLTPEFQVNSYTTSFQGNPAVSTLSDEKFVATWTSLDQDGSGYGVYGRVFTFNGTTVYALTPEFQVNSYTTNDQGYEGLAVTTLLNRAFVVSWNSYGQDGDDRGIFAKIFDFTEKNEVKNITSEFQVNSYTTSFQWRSVASNLSESEFVILWDQNKDGFGIFGRIFEVGFCVPPILTENQLTINENATIILDDNMLNVIYANNSYRIKPLIFNIENLQHGLFENINDIGTPITSFSRQEVANNEIRFVHDGSEYSPSYEVRASEGTCFTENYPATITFTNVNDNAPTLINNQLTIKEGETIVLNSTMLNANDIDINPTLAFQVRNIQHGQFENRNDQGVAITSFTKQQIIAGDIQFIHDGGEIPPSYEIRVSDGIFESVYQAVNVNFIPINDPPQLITNQLTVRRGEKVIITDSVLSATDSDNEDEMLLFKIQKYKHGYFAYVNNTNELIISFIQQQIAEQKITFIHDGSKNKPSYEIQVTDGQLETLWNAANITFVLARSSNPSKFLYQYLIIGGGIAAALSCLCITTMGIIIVAMAPNVLKKQEQKQKQNQNQNDIVLSSTNLELGNFLINYKVDYEDFKVVEYIGDGASATVFKAKWEGRDVAYKVFNSVAQKDIKDFENEAKIMLTTNHPNIVRLYKVCINNQGNFGLLMEYMEMGTLKEFLSKKAVKLTWGSKWNIAYDLASVLKFLHNQNIIHRDIKTDNVLLYKENNEIRAKVADFGLSKQQQTGKTVTMAVGTYKYMAPEMVLGIEGTPVGHLSMKPVDIYALGMIFVALMTEKEPFPNVISDIIIPIRVAKGELKPKLSRDKYPFLFFKLTNRCHAIKPDDRPTAKEVVDELSKMKNEIIAFKLS